MKSFASDNYAPAHPKVIAAIQAANQGHAPSYGSDSWTQKATIQIQQLLETNASVYFVFNGTGANVSSLSAATNSYHAILCADIAHIYNDESSAPESFTGCRIFPIPTNEEGKITIEQLSTRAIRSGDKHYPQGKILSITQCTEYGTVYSLEELKVIRDFCNEQNWLLHIDGARLFNAMAGLSIGLKEMITDISVDILSLGGTKNGLLYGEAVIVLNPILKKDFEYRHKQSMQLASKNRYIAAQFTALFEDELWRELASHSNKMASLLQAELRKFHQIKITKPVQANAVFVIIPSEWEDILKEAYPFYTWRADINEMRLMCSWDTQEEDIKNFVAIIKKLAEA